MGPQWSCSWMAVHTMSIHQRGSDGADLQREGDGFTVALVGFHASLSTRRNNQLGDEK